MAATKAERFAEFIRRLAAAVPATSEEEALHLLASTLNAVEDDFTEIPFQPQDWASDGRMYPPQADSRRTVPQWTDAARYRTRGHYVWIGPGGAIRIEEVDGSCVINKPGRDGCRVEQS